MPIAKLVGRNIAPASFSMRAKVVRASAGVVNRPGASRQTAPHNLLDDLIVRRVGGFKFPGNSTVTQNRDAIGDRHDLLDVVRDENDARTGRRDRAHEAK